MRKENQLQIRLKGSKMNLRAVLFDVGGTIAENEEIHRKSFNLMPK